MLTPSPPSLPELLEARAARTPDSTALIATGRNLTYADLQAEIGRIAAALVDAGCGPGSLVAVCADRTAMLPAALLAVLRSGAAYVPVDPSFPVARIRQMLDDAEPSAVLLDRKGAAVLGSVRAKALVIEDLPAAPAPPLPAIRPDDPAYVIYTSGSTGRPKGVVVEHRGLANVVTAVADLVGARASDRLLAVTTVSFDIAGLELFLPLLVGGTVVLAQRNEALDGRVLARLIEHFRISLMQATPATWRMLVDGGWEGRPGLRALVGGEALPRTLGDALLTRVDALWNVYGPTETTIWSTAHRVTAGQGPVPIGRALANTSLHVLDAELRPAQEGELCIGGVGVARGYLKQAERTRERFVPEPGTPDARMYRTGDRCRWRPDGELEFLGRLDHQVKVRGYRVEPAEVEAVLSGHPAIAEVVTGVRRLGDTDSLVAYVRPRDGAAPTLAELRRWGAERLPPYMLPTALIPVAQLPRTPAGKTDRAALAALELPAAAESATVPDASEDLELIVLNVLREVLGLDAFGAADDFFDMGGHSLLAFRAAQEIERQTGRPVDVALLFEHSTPDALSHVLRERGGIAVAATAIELQPRGEAPPLFCVCGVSLYLPLARALAPDQPVVAIYVDADLAAFHGESDDASVVTVEDLADRYVEQIRQRRPHGPYRLLGFSTGGAVAFEVARRLIAEGERVEIVAMIDSYLPESVRRRPLASARHFLASTLRRGPRWALRRIRHELANRRPQPPQAASVALGASLAERRQAVEARGDAIAAAYQPAPLDVDVMLFNAADRPRPAHYAYDESGGWREQVGEKVEVVMVPGDHDELLAAPEASGRIARALRNRLGILERFGVALVGALFTGEAPAVEPPIPPGEYRTTSRAARPGSTPLETAWTRGIEPSPPARRGHLSLAERRQQVEARSDAIAASYRARPLDVDVLLFNAAHRPRPVHYAYDETGGWRAMVGNRIEVVMVPGDHTDLLSVAASTAQIAHALRFHRTRLGGV